MGPPVIVIGAGVGGLTTAALLAARGVPVTVCEAAPTPGGKLREVVAAGRAIDAGPTVFTMRWVFDEIFAAAGARLDDHLTLTRATTLARHAWSGGATLDLFADLDRSAAAVGDFAGAAEAARFRAFMAGAARTYATLKDSYLAAPATTPAGLARRIGMSRDLARIHPFATLWGALGRAFRDPRLRQLFGRYATYSGSSPFLAPATLMLIAHVEADGVWAVGGGMHGIARALAGLAERHGAAIRYAAPVAEIVVGRDGAEAVVLASGERLAARAVVVNADPQALASGCFGAAAVTAVPPLAPADRSLSALTLTLVGRTHGFALDHHNVFFSDDYAAEFADLAAGRLPRQPSVYVCASDRAGGGGGDGGGAERLHLIVNAPAIGDALAAADVAAGEAAAFARLAACGLDVVPEATVRTTPGDFARLFPATGGALYGRASHGWRASFQRPGATTRIPRLFLAGGATHPGAGVPMAALSGRLAAAAVLDRQR